MMKQPMSHDIPKELEQIVQSIYGSDFLGTYTSFNG